MDDVVAAYTKALARANDRHVAEDSNRDWDWGVTGEIFTHWLNGDVSDRTAIDTLNLIK